jgi:oligoribonuclease NrnB/cAMP/cGMP phosphodiesterase (DHH superfamily)
MNPNLQYEPISVKTLFPKESYFKTDDEILADKKREITSISQDTDILLITHTDADGYGCEVVTRLAYDDTDKKIAVITADPYNPCSVEQIGEYIADSVQDDTTVLISDLSPSRPKEFINSFTKFSDLHVIDHHDEWDDKTKNIIGSTAELHIDQSKCATQIMRDTLEDKRNIGLSHLDDFVTITADHDLWIKNIPEKSDKLADLAAQAEREEYVEICSRCILDGRNIIEDSEARDLIQNRQSWRNRTAELALKRAESFSVGQYRVALTYGRCGQSKVGQVLQDELDADLSIILKPGGRISFRSTDDCPIARDVAILFDGGGHECAAGASISEFVKDVGIHKHCFTKGSESRTYIQHRLENSRVLVN